jgi:hypothetical protein
VSVTRLLDPDRVLCVLLPKISIVNKFKNMFPWKHKVPRPKDRGRLTLEREVFPVFVTPDFIIHSAKLRKFASLTTGIVDPAWAASNASRRRKWYPVAPIKGELAAFGGWPDISVYVSRWASDLSLVTDSRSVARPDLIIECTELKERREQDIEKAKLEHRVLKPKLGTFIVSRGPVSKKEGMDLENGIRLLSVGFDRTKLRPIVDALVGPNKARG